jgi:hypothetical protein
VTDPSLPSSAAPFAAQEHARASLWMPHRGLFLLFGVLLAFGAPAALLLGAWRNHVTCDRAADQCVVRESTGATYHWYVREVHGLGVEDRGAEGFALVLYGDGSNRYIAGSPDRAPLDVASARFAAFLRDPSTNTIDVSAGHPAEKWIALASAVVGLVLLAFGFRRTVFDVDPVARRLTIEKRTWPLVPPTILERRPLADVERLRLRTNIDGANKLSVVVRGVGAVPVHTGLEPKDADRVARVLGVEVESEDGG